MFSGERERAGDRGSDSLTSGRKKDDLKGGRHGDLLMGVLLLTRVKRTTQILVVLIWGKM